MIGSDTEINNYSDCKEIAILLLIILSWQNKLISQRDGSSSSDGYIFHHLIFYHGRFEIDIIYSFIKKVISPSLSLRNVVFVGVIVNVIDQFAIG